MVASQVTLKGQRGYPFGLEEHFAAMMTVRQEMVVSSHRNCTLLRCGSIKQMGLSFPISAVNHLKIIKHE